MEFWLQIIFLLWFIVLPILGISLLVFIPVVWFFIVPSIARSLTWNRFRKCSWHIIADDSGYAWLIATKEEIPEGIVRTKKGWRFIPRPVWLLVKRTYELVKGDERKKETDHVEMKTKRTQLSKKEKEVEKEMLKPYTWADTGKPLWIGYAGKVVSSNFATLAGILQKKASIPNVEAYIDKILAQVKSVDSKEVRDKISSMLKELVKGVNFKEITYIDPTLIKKLYPKMFTPSMLDAFGTNREERGRKRAGKQYTSLFIGGAIIIGLVILGCVALLATMQ